MGGEQRIRVLIAPDSFKGSLTAVQACEAMSEGVLAVFPQAECDAAPMADGGEGTVDALVRATGGSVRQALARDPLGRRIHAAWGLLGDGRTAVVEMASASGLPLLRDDERDPRVTSTYGTGELIAEALETLHSSPDTGQPPPRLIIGIGGSATNDCGTGALNALGAGFLDSQGRPLPPGGAALAKLARIDLSGLHPLLGRTDILVACDVSNPLTGERGASAVFGPQKGATPAMIQELDQALGHFAIVAAATVGKNVADTPGAGAAGGLGAGLLFFTSARLRPGVEIVLDAVNFDQRAGKADLVLTGEGHSDFQTAFGKAPVGVARAAKKQGKAVICISGALGPGVENLYAQGIDGLAGVVCSITTLEQSMERAAPLLRLATERTLRLLRVGMDLGLGLCNDTT